MDGVKKIQLFLIPFAGGGATSFNKLISCLDNRIEAVPLEYAGRGERRHEEFITEYDTFQDDVLSNIEKSRNFDLPYALMGYSLGTALMYDLIRMDKLRNPPVTLIPCAREFLEFPRNTRHFASLPEDEFIEKINEMGGVDERILNNKRFRNIYLEPLKADYKIWGQYRYHEMDKMLDSDLLVFYSETDTPFDQVSSWKDITTGNTEFYALGHSHFFIKDYYKDMAEIINRKLIKYFV